VNFLILIAVSILASSRVATFKWSSDTETNCFRGAP
jgi:hypothetical protein